MIILMTRCIYSHDTWYNANPNKANLGGKDLGWSSDLGFITTFDDGGVDEVDTKTGCLILESGPHKD